MIIRYKTLCIALLISFFLPLNAGAYNDLSADSPYFEAVTLLTQNGVLQGYDDNTFRPEQKVNRAEALKIILKSIGVEATSGLYNTGFPDVPIDAWYAGYIMEGLLRNIISGNPDGTFAGGRTVNKAEFLKMTLKAYGTNISKYSVITEFIAHDVPLDAWFANYLNYAKTVGLTSPDLSINLYPEKELNRGESALFVYRMKILQSGGDMQEYLSITEASLTEALAYINNDDISNSLKLAEQAVGYSDMAVKLDGTSAIAKAANKMALAFQKLFSAYKAGLNSASEEVNNLALEARGLAHEAAEINPDINYLAIKVVEQADNLIDQLN